MTQTAHDILLKTDDLKTYFGAKSNPTKAVDGISFQIRRGETFCLVGESGSGKSITSLSVIGLIPQPAGWHPGGSIVMNINGSDIDLLKTPESAMRTIRGAKIAMIFQEPMTALNPVLTIGEQITEVLFLHTDLNTEQAKARAIELLQQVQIPTPAERFNEYPHRLSGGQRQRVMIAMAMACEPDLLIADEPTTALDVTVQAGILDLMRDLQKKNNMAILFITHDIGVVAQIADRVAVMYLGKIVETGNTEQIIKNPQHDYTRRLIGALPENLKQHKPKLIEQISQRLESSGRGRKQIDTNSVLLQTVNLKVHFPIKRGIMQNTVDHVRAVDGVDLSIQPGKIMALVGESGCGKTTLGRAILRLIEPTSGQIIFDHKEISRLNPHRMRPFRREMQIAFQDPYSSLNPRIRILDTLIEPMAVHGIGDDKAERVEIARKIIQRVHLSPDMVFRYPHEFSGGQRQRIGIARCLVLKPRFIVCDEVTSALDVSVQASILELLLELRAELGLAYLFITHDISVVEYLADETAVMYKGKIVERGDTQRVCGDPREPYTKKLLSAVPRIQW